MQTGPQQRQQIRDQLGVLEERLEELGALARAGESLDSHGQFGSDLLLRDALEAIRDLSQLVHEQQLLKSISSQDFLLRISSLMVQSAHAKGVNLSISHHGAGRISIEMAELVTGAVIAAFRSSLASHGGLTQADRVRLHLFRSGSVYLELQATPGEVQFRLLDDGRGFAPTETSAFHKVREHVALCGGWFAHKSFEPCGGMIEFKVPLFQNRVESLVLRQGAYDVLLPSTCVLEVSRAAGKHALGAVTNVFRLEEKAGMARGDLSSPVLLRVGVADIQFWIACDEIVETVKARRAAAGEFFEEDCWLKTLGIFNEDGVARALPMIDGTALVRFHLALGGEV